MKWHVKRNNVHSYISGELRLRRGSKAASTCLEQKLFFKYFLFLLSNAFPAGSYYFFLYFTQICCDDKRIFAF